MNYRKAILIHAYALPLLMAVVVAAAILFGLTRFTSGQQEKIADYQQYTSLNQQVLNAESFVAGKRDLAAAWHAGLEGEFQTRLNQRLPAILGRFESGSLEQTLQSRPSGSGGLGVAGGQPHSRWQLEFRGHFEPMQLALLELENSLPQMQLETLNIQTTGDDQLDFRCSYTVWETPSNP